jgi:hypothetical protein
MSVARLSVASWTAGCSQPCQALNSYAARHPGSLARLGTRPGVDIVAGLRLQESPPVQRQGHLRTRQTPPSTPEQPVGRYRRGRTLAADLAADFGLDAAGPVP